MQLGEPFGEDFILIEVAVARKSAHLADRPRTEVSQHLVDKGVIAIPVADESAARSCPQTPIHVVVRRHLGVEQRLVRHAPSQDAMQLTRSVDPNLMLLMVPVMAR